MITYANRGKKAKVKTAGVGKRVVVVFGQPGSGVSTLLDVLSKATETPNIVMPYVGPDSLSSAELALEDGHAEVVFLDVDGGLFTPEDVQNLVDSRMIYSGSGAVIRVHSPNELVIERCSNRQDYVKDTDLKEWAEWISGTEQRIREHSLQYFMIPNVGLEEAVQQLALRSGLVR